MLRLKLEQTLGIKKEKKMRLKLKKLKLQINWKQRSYTKSIQL